MRPTVLRTTLVALLLATLAACSGDGDGPATGAEGEAEATADVAEPDDAGDGEASDDDGSEPEDGAVRTALPDLDTLALRTPSQDLGPFPTLAWEAHPDAQRYRVTVYRDGDAWWSWSGTATEVVLGGYSEPPDPDVPVTPRLDEAMTFDVVAHAEDAMVARSAERTLRP